MEHPATVPTDEELLEAVRGGRRRAMAALYQRHGDAVRAYARRVCGDSRADEADVIAEDVFVSLWRDPASFAGELPLRSMLLAAAYRRTVRQGPTVERRPEEQALLLTWSPDDIRHLLPHLPEGVRHAVTMAYFGACTTRQLATLLSLPESSAVSELSAGLRRLHLPARAPVAAGPPE